MILKQHTEWVRDVAWCPAMGNDYNTLASCSEVKYYDNINLNFLGSTSNFMENTRR